VDTVRGPQSPAVRAYPAINITRALISKQSPLIRIKWTILE
jgi:hypothetical protein